MAQRNFGDIQKRIASVSAEIAKLQLEYAKLKNAGKSTEEIQKQLNGSFEKLTKKLTTLTNVTKQYNNQSSTTAKQATSANKALGQTSKQYATLSSSINKATSVNNSFGLSFRKAFSPAAWGSAIGNVVKFLGVYQLLYAAVNLVKEAIGGSIKSFIEFEDAIGKLRSITAANAEETKILSESIRQSAVQTRFTATQVAALATSLAKLGATSSEIPSLLMPISLAAQALGADLNTVGESVFKVSNQFGLSAAESSTTAQTLVSSINSSALSLESFNTAIQYIGPIASQVGLTFSETAGYLETLADNGFSASRIGTGLRGIFIDLKESGVPLIDTLKKLADENISVARASDLVGKRAAAQLITILDNIDAIKEGGNENKRFAESLRASASQMDTAAGQLDILKSAYEDLKISIGDTITSTEFFLDLLGILNEDSEELARGYRLLDQVFAEEGGFNIVSKSVELLSDNTVDASSAILSAISVIGQAGKSPEFINAFDAVNMAQIKLKGNILSNADAFKILEKATTSNLSTFATWLQDGLGLSGKEASKLTTALIDARVQFGEIENDVIAIKGIAGIFEKQALAVQTSNQVSIERNRIEEEYADTVGKIKNLTPGSNQAIQEATDLQRELSDEIKKTQDELDEERAKGILGNRILINQLEGRISGYRNVRKSISDLNDTDKDIDKEKEEARKNQLKLDKDRIELRRAEVQEEIRQIKKIKDERIKEIEARLQREKEAASTVAEAREAEEKAAASIADTNREVQNALEETTRKTKELIDETLGLKTEYEEDFPDAFNTFSLSFEKILFDLQEAVRGSTLSPSELADSLLGSANTLFAEYEQKLQELKNTLGDSPQGQLDFVEASKQQFEVLKGELDKLIGTYNTYKESLTLERGEDAANEILAPFEAIIAIIQNKVNEAGQAVGKTAEEIAKKTKENIKEILVDGLSDALDAAIKALDKFNQVAFENTKDRIDREKELVESRYDVEGDILKSQLDNQLITEEEYRNKQEKLRRNQIGEENTLDKSLFDAQQKRDRQSATSDYLQAIASIVPNLIITDKDANPVTIALKAAITSGIATASYGAELAAISQRKFIPKRFAEGGIVDGPSHAEGGVPFTVRGRGGYEMEGGEFVVNKRAAQLHRSVLERINNSTRPTAMSGKYNYENESAVIKFAQGGAVSASSTAREASIEQLQYLRAIAETNSSIAQNSSKPVRAYVTNADLNSNSAERKIKERNTLI